MTYSKFLILQITHIFFLFQFCGFLFQFVYHWKIKGLRYYSTPNVTLTISGNNVNLIKRGQTNIKKLPGTKYNEHIGEKR
jgi:hypothetical protein